ncbi:hypothetical protein MP228_009852 [Amoeboaphelidium protococcarum]|nr:hypothetical protein MP228_009852 [Amoeboaphelidium protococcarum]
MVLLWTKCKELAREVYSSADFWLRTRFNIHPGFQSKLDDIQHVICRIVYHDQNYLIVDKPHNVNVVLGDKSRISVQRLLSINYPLYHIRNIHRLDFGTSGVYVIATNQWSARDGGLMLKHKLARKIYYALVEGHIDMNNVCQRLPERVTKMELTNRSDSVSLSQYLITIRLGQSLIDEKKVTSELDAENVRDLRECSTILDVVRIGYYNNHPCTLVRLSPLSGRTHQLRVHMKSIGHTIIGDTLYESSVQSPRMYLHSSQISFDFEQLNKKYAKIYGRASSIRQPSAAAKQAKPSSRLTSVPSQIKVWLFEAEKRVCNWLKILDSSPCRTTNFSVQTPGIPFIELIQEQTESAE